MGPELGILVADAAAPALDLALARVERPDETQLFFMDDGVFAAADPRVRALVDAGAEAALCAMDAEARGLHAPIEGVRFGSQWDHAVMLRSAARVLVCTGAAVEESRPQRDEARLVAVTVARAGKAAQALRAAVGYAAAGLRVVVVAPELDAQSPSVHRPLATLRGLAVPFVDGPPADADVRVTW
jgi:hypothetical protein